MKLTCGSNALFDSFIYYNFGCLIVVETRMDTNKYKRDRETETKKKKLRR